MNTSALQTERLALRRPSTLDLGPYTQYCQSDRTKYVGGPFSDVQAFEKLASMIGHWELRGFGRFVFTERETGRALGHIGALQLDPASPPEFTWTIWRGEDERKGFAFEAARVYKTYAEKQLGFTVMLVRILRDNLASRRLAERLGGVLDEDATPPKWLPNSLTYSLKLIG